jgi:hypothetical protein
LRTDPTDTGGLFVGRRPGTAPTHYRAQPEGGSPGRRRLDALVAHAVLALMVVVNLLFWGPLPALSLWIASQVQYQTGSSAILLGLWPCWCCSSAAGAAQAHRAWILARRAVGHDQRQGALGRVFATTAVIDRRVHLLAAVHRRARLHAGAALMFAIPAV